MGPAIRDGEFAILIVEDEMLLVLSLELTIGEAGYRVVGSGTNRQEAIEIARRDRPDLALVDLRLSRGESGLDVARELKSLSVPSLLMTGNRPEKALPELALGCLSKPFADASLLESIAAARARLTEGRWPTDLPPELQIY